MHENSLHTGEAPAIHTLMNELEPEMASQEVFCLENSLFA